MVLVLFALTLLMLLVAGGYQTYERALREFPVETVVDAIQCKSTYTPLSQIPQIYKEAVLAVEDRRFYRHKGIDLLAIWDAFLCDVRAGELIAGGSTITQQFCKNQFFTQKKILTRKIAEVFMVREIERRYTKDEILELYINSIYYGAGYYNIADASRGYFGKAPIELNAWECTLLAGIPNAPSAYALTVNPELAQKRQRQVLDAMVQCRYLTKKGANTILLQCPEDFQKKNKPKNA